MYDQDGYTLPEQFPRRKTKHLQLISQSRVKLKYLFHCSELARPQEGISEQIQIIKEQPTQNVCTYAQKKDPNHYLNFMCLENPRKVNLTSLIANIGRKMEKEPFCIMRSVHFQIAFINVYAKSGAEDAHFRAYHASPHCQEELQSHSCQISMSFQQKSLSIWIIQQFCKLDKCVSSSLKAITHTKFYALCSSWCILLKKKIKK